MIGAGPIGAAPIGAGGDSAGQPGTGVSFAATAALQPSTRRIQYPSLAEPINFSVSAETVTVDKWFQLPSQPSAARKMLAAVRASSGIAAGQPEHVTLATWLQPPSQPTKGRVQSAAIRASSGQAPIDPAILTQPETVSEDRWHSPASQPVVRRLSAAVVAASGPSWVAPEIVAGEEVTPDKWHQAPSQPVEARRLPAAVLASSGQAPVDPVALTQPETVSEDRWHPVASQPRITRTMPEAVRSSGPAEVDPAALTQPETVSVDRWFQPPSQPVRRARSALATGTVLTPAEGVTVDRWFQASPQPVRRPDPQRAARAAGPTTVFPDVAVVETVTLDKWHTPPSQPVRRARSVAQTGSAPISPAALILAETVSADRFLPQVNQPIIVRHMPEAVRASSGQVPTDPRPVAPPPPGEPGTGRNPGAVVSQVSRRRIQFPSKAEPVFVATAPHVEPNLDQFPWRQAPSQPVLTRRLPTSVRASSGQAPIDPTALTAQETVTADRWAQPASQPVLRHALPAAVLATTGVAAGDLTPATPSEPATAGTGRNPGAVFAQRSQRRVQFPAKADVVYVAPAPHVEPSLDAFPWRQPPSQPVITRKMSAAVRASSGQAPIDPTALTAREAVTADRWAQPPSQPVRRRGLSGAIQATTGTQPADLTPGTPTEPVTAGTGYNPGAGFAQVSRRVSQYPAIVDPIYIPPPPTTDALPWRQPPSQPVRARRSVANHQALAWSGYTPPYVPLPDFPLVVQADMPRPRRRDPNLQYFASVNAAIQTAPLTARVLVNWVD